MTCHLNELEQHSKNLIERYNNTLDGLKRKNSLLILAQKFKKLEERCIELSEREIN